MLRNPDRPAEAAVLDMQENSTERKRLKKITDLEKWEIKQVRQTRLLLSSSEKHPGASEDLLSPSDDCSQRTSQGRVPGI